MWLLATVVVVGGFALYHVKSSAAGGMTYQTAQAQTGSLVVSVSGTGQVSASNQLDIKPTIAGTVTYVNITPGEHIKAGTLLAEIDPSNGQKSVSDAQISLQKAQLSLQQLQEPSDQSTLIADQTAITQAQQTIQTDQNNLNKAYQDAADDIASAFVDLPAAMNGLDSILHAETLNIYANQPNVSYYADNAAVYDTAARTYKDNAENTYTAVHNEYLKNFQDYNSAIPLTDHTAIENMLGETEQTSKDMASAAQATQAIVQFYEDEFKAHGLTPVSLADTNLTSAKTYSSNASTDTSTLSSDKQTIQTDEQAIINAQTSLQQKQAVLDIFQKGPDPLQIQAAQLAVQQAQNALNDAQSTLADYYIRAPFDGIAATVGVKKGDSASASTVISSFITTDDIAQLSLNEVDATKVKVGQDATLTFDAIPNFSIAGKIAEIDTLGTVAQGVVSYAVQIGFATQDPRVKPGMSVSASIITNAHQQTLTVPSAAVKNAGGQSYVELLVNGEIHDQSVTVGLSNDTMTEILSGLKEGDEVITATINPSAVSTSSGAKNSTPNIGGGGGTFFHGGGGGQTMRIGG